MRHPSGTETGGNRTRRKERGQAGQGKGVVASASLGLQGAGAGWTQHSQSPLGGLLLPGLSVQHLLAGPRGVLLALVFFPSSG